MTTETDLTQPAQLLELLKAEHAALLREGRSLAELIGMSQAHLDKLLSGEKVARAPSLKKIAAYFARTRESGSEADAGDAARTATAVESVGSGVGGATIRVLELGAVEQRQYIAAMLESLGIPKGIASYVGLHVELDGSLSAAAGLRAARALAQAMLEEEAAEEEASSSSD